MAHLSGPTEINPGLPSIAQGTPVAFVQAGSSFKDVDGCKGLGSQGIELTMDLPFAGDGHRKGPKIEERGPL
jgi:hypothetical protein